MSGLASRIFPGPERPLKLRLMALMVPLDVVTTRDYHVVMKNVGIADLKAHLSRHLKSVRRGETITVLDRDTPVARLVPIESTANGLVIHPPTKPGRLCDVKLPPRPKGLKTDVVELLMELRGDR